MSAVAGITLAVKKLMDSEAAQYETERGHGFADAEEERAWRKDITDAITFKQGGICLDVGAGTGVLTRLLAEWVGPEGHVVAADLSGAMLSVNEKILPPEMKERVSFVTGDIHDDTMLNTAAHKTFDYIACRQVVGIFLDPIVIFKRWYQSLKESGQVVILDALWTRRSWSGGWDEVIDHHPLACVQSLATVAYCLKQAGFSIEQSAFLPTVNGWFEKTQSQQFDCPRYIVVARKN